jgi:2,5-diamino-6-(ribosylamino)-4(3H)-pyrimidinone 5'-phosphate reductase
MASKRGLPFVFVNVATTADGKLAPANRHFVPFGSKRDQELLLELRAYADAVMSGARTVGPMPVNLGPGPAKYRQMRLRKGLPEYNLRVVVSGSGNLNPRAEIFRHRFSPIIVLVTQQASELKLRRLREVADDVKAFGDKQLNFTQALRWLREKWGVKRLLCEGGGEVNWGLFHEGLVDEVYQTLCPLVFGGRNAPTMADGRGVPALAGATRLRLKSLKRVGDELYLVWRTLKW